MKIDTVCFSGHRKIPPEELERIKKELRITVLGLIERGYTKFYTGGAEGFDFLATESVAEMKREFPDIILKIIFPYKSARKENEYKTLLPYVNGIEYACDKYYSWAYHERNRMMVDRSSVCVCYLTKQSGGTAYTASYALENGAEIIMI